MGLLGNLLGGIGGGFGGSIRNVMQRKSGGGSSFSSSPVSNKTTVRDAEPQDQAEQTAPQQAQPEPEKQPPQPQITKQVAEDIAKPVAQQQADKTSPISGLLDEAPVSKPVDASGTTDETPAAPTIVNNAPTMTPVSRPADEQAGQIPTTFKTDGVLNQLMDSGSNRQPMEFQEGMPTRTPSIEDRSFQFAGPGSVSGALPARRYRARV